MIKSLKDILNPDIINDDITSINGLDGKVLRIKENEKDSKIKELKIRGFKDSPLAFTLDHTNLPQLSQYLHKGHDCINKKCDIVIFYQDYIVIAELKSDRKRDAEMQLFNSDLFIKYLLTLLEAYKKGKYKEVKIKHIIFTTDPKVAGTKARTMNLQDSEKQGDQFKYKIVPLRGQNKNASIHINDLI